MSDNPATAPRYCLSTQHVADLLGVTATKVADMCRDELLPSILVASVWRIREDVVAWLEAKTAATLAARAKDEKTDVAA